MELVGVQHQRGIRRIPPMKFALWVALASISMLFAGFISAYIVRMSAGNWLEFELPSIFLASTMIIVVSSVTLQIAFMSFKQKREWRYKGFLLVSLFLGLAFVALQYQGWMDMLAMGIDLKGNPSGAFVYMISGVHLAHILGGIAVLIVACLHAFGLPFVITEKRVERLDLTCQYWHYVDLLWIVLFLFLTFYR